MRRAKQARYIAIDTEFVWERTYYPTLGVVQIGFSEDEAFLIDAPAIEDITPLGKILADSKVTKILHDAHQDLTILRRATGAFPKNVFDTRCVAGFVGLSSSISLSSLLKDILEVDLSKTETRTNWLQRPLTKKQISYALDDVRHLPAARDVLIEKAKKLGRKKWVDGELAGYNDSALYDEHKSKDQFLKVKGVGKLTPRRRIILRELAAWREETAREKNRPRPWILPDETLINIAQKKPLSVSELEPLKGLSDKAIRRYGETIISLVEKGLTAAEKERGKQPVPRSGEESLNARVDFALSYLKGKSMAEGIDPALVASRADVTALVRERKTASSKDHRL